MHTLRLLFFFVGSSIAVTAFGANTAAVTPARPELAPLVAPRSVELREAGIQKIVTRTGKKRRDIQVFTQYGPVYFAWPKNVTPVLFEIELGQGGTPTVRASDYSDSDKARYAAAFDAIFPEALRGARSARATAQRPRA